MILQVRVNRSDSWDLPMWTDIIEVMREQPGGTFRGTVYRWRHRWRPG